MTTESFMFNGKVCVYVYVCVYIVCVCVLNCLANFTFLSFHVFRINHICEKDKSFNELFSFLKLYVECAFWLFPMYIMCKIIKAPSQPDSSGL